MKCVTRSIKSNCARAVRAVSTRCSILLNYNTCRQFAKLTRRQSVSHFLMRHAQSVRIPLWRARREYQGTEGKHYVNRSWWFGSRILWEVIYSDRGSEGLDWFVERKNEICLLYVHTPRKQLGRWRNVLWKALVWEVIGIVTITKNTSIIHRNMFRTITWKSTITVTLEWIHRVHN